MISVERFLAEHPVRLGQDDPSESRSGGSAAPAVRRLQETGVAGGSIDGGNVDGGSAGGGFGQRTEQSESDHGFWQRRDAQGSGTKRRGMKRRVPVRGGFGAPHSGVAVRVELEDPGDADACREAALSLLDAAPRSSGALADRLAEKGYDSATVDQVIVRLRELGLLDDDAYAQSVIRSCVSRMMGARGAAQELSRKGVDRALAARVVAEASEAGVFEECAWELGRQVARRTEGLDRDVRLRRFWSAGGRKGHAPDVLSAIAHELFQ